MDATMKVMSCSVAMIVAGANANATIGYRYARPGGLFFQVAATPIFDSHRVYPWAGISNGKSY